MVHSKKTCKKSKRIFKSSNCLKINYSKKTQKDRKTDYKILFVFVGFLFIYILYEFIYLHLFNSLPLFIVIYYTY